MNAPTSLRGDLDPPATVTSDFEVTNPGNTPLANVSVTDDVCGAADPVPTTGDNAGDTDGDGLLDVGETWQFTCTREVSTPDSTNPAGQNIVNTATASGTPPDGDQVTDTATDDVDAFNPAITLTKLVNGQQSVTIGSGTDVTYTYEVANTGNTPLGSVVLGDDTPPCESPTRGADAPGNDDDILGVGETWTYSCTSQPTQDVHNIADVTGTPLNPTQGNAPSPGAIRRSRPLMTPTSSWSTPPSTLSKTADPSDVLFGEDQTEQAVTYRFTATNPGEEPLNRPGADGGGPGTKDPGWVEDIAPDQPGPGRCDVAPDVRRRRHQRQRPARPRRGVGVHLPRHRHGADGQHRPHHRPALERRTAAPFPASTRSRTWPPPSSDGPSGDHHRQDRVA